MARVRALTVVRLAVISGVAAAAAAPSAGRVYVVAQNHPAAADEGPGAPDAPFRTISAAARLAGPGDIVLVREGVYRERVTPARGGAEGRPVVYSAAEGERVTVKGSEVWAPEWRLVEEGVGEIKGDMERDIEGHILAGTLEAALFAGTNPFHRSISIGGADSSREVRPIEGDELEETLGQVFLDGAPLDQVTSMDDLDVRRGTWLVAASGDEILVSFPAGVNPATATVEISTRERIFCPRRRGLGHIHVRGFIFEHCANQGPFPQGGALSVRSGHHWLIEKNTIRYAKTIGLDCGSETWASGALRETDADQKRIIIGGQHVIRENVVSDNGLCGIAGWNHGGTKILRNLIERNNRLRFPHGEGWEEWAGIKLHAADALIEGNLVRDNFGHGIWLDNGWQNARVKANLVLGNRLSGIFVELGDAKGKPCVVSGNVVGRSKGEGFYPGFGIYAHDASDVVVTHNLVFDNAAAGILMRTITNRRFGGRPVETSRNRIVGNVITGNAGPAVSLPYPNARGKDNRVDANVYSSGPGAAEVLFHLNKYVCAFSYEEVARTLGEKLAEAGVRRERWPDLETWPKNPVLTLEQWRVLMGFDGASVVSDDLGAGIGK